MISLNAPAPDFQLTNADGQLVRLSDFRGQPVALMFYPADETPGCTEQACAIRDGFAALQAAGVVVLGISPDAPAVHQGFRSHYQLPQILLSDPEHQVLTAWEAWGPKNFYGKMIIGVRRTTWLIGADGLVKKQIKRVDRLNHAQQILKLFGF